MSVLDEFEMFDGWERKSTYIRDPSYFLTQSYMHVKPQDTGNVSCHPLREVWMERLHHMASIKLSLIKYYID